MALVLAKSAACHPRARQIPQGSKVMAERQALLAGAEEEWLMLEKKASNDLRRVGSSCAGMRASSPASITTA
ncbi:hypothetical protein LAZ29_07960 [Cereibacter sphaeroides]|uniref:hypothetical protein n=1 Tax=Cereibacter sphaeroides TaxID=1063 RepID=UPI001F40F547|nr:hypothetical protein [Cereibacter sphaeroides]MCE6950864.1 hypothetical protein [Cereibacter sphaeroides]